MSSQARLLPASEDATAAVGLPRVLPSPLALFVFAIGVILVSITIAKGVSDPDYFWHVTTGRLIATTGHIPSTDPFSFTWIGRPWILHEWLSELLLYGLIATIGTGFTAVIFGLIAPAMVLVLAVALRRLAIGMPAIIAGCSLGALVLVPFITLRPQAVSWLLMAGLIAILMQLGARRPVWALILVPYFALWANLHGLWVVGLGVLVLYLLFTLFGRTAMASHWPWMVAAATGSALAVMATPAGPGGILYPLRYARPGNWGLANIQEWQSPNFHDAAHWGFLILILAVALTASRRTPGWLTAVALLGIALGLVAIRNEPVGAVFAIPALVLGLDERIPRRFAQRLTHPHSLSIQLGRRVLEMVLALLIAAAGALTILPGSPLHVVAAAKDPYPSAAVDVLLRMKPDVRVLAEYGWGGYVIYRVYDAGGRVFVDGRNDMYSEQILNDYSAIRDVSGDWIALTKRYGVEALLLPPYTTITKGPATAAGWCEAYRDEQAVLLVQDCSLLTRR
jgi:hypothetical protein